MVCVEYRVCDAAFHPPTLASPSTKVKLRLFWRPCAWGDSLYPVWCVCFHGDDWDRSDRQRDRRRLPFPTVNTWIDQLFYTGAFPPELAWARDTVWERAWLISRGLKFFTSLPQNERPRGRLCQDFNAEGGADTRFGETFAGARRRNPRAEEKAAQMSVRFTARADRTPDAPRAGDICRTANAPGFIKPKPWESCQIWQVRFRN